MNKYYVLLVTLSLFVSPMPALSAGKMRIAIMDFKAKDISKNEAEKVTELIRNEMVNTGKFTIIERDQMGNILKEQGLQQTGCTDVTCAVEVGKMLSARKILVGTIMNLSGSIVITGRIVDVQSGVVEFSEKGVARAKEDVYKAVIQFTNNLANRIQGISDTEAVEEEPEPEPIKEVEVVEKEKEPEPLKDVEKVKEPERVEVTESISNPNLWPSIGMAGLTVISFGTGIYYNNQINDTRAEYEDAADEYNKADNVNDAERLGNKMTSLEDDADKYTIYRNISYGVSAAFLLTAGYFIYRYFTYDAASVASAYNTGPQLMPVFYTSFMAPQTQGICSMYFLGGGIIIRY